MNIHGIEQQDVESIISARLDRLRRIGDSIPRPSCSSDNIIVVEDHPYGRSGNNMLELVHGIWMAEATKTSLHIPRFMKSILSSFHHGSLTRNFCASFHGKSRSMYVRAVELLNIWMIFKEEKFKSHFPPLTPQVVDDAASLYIRILSSLWAHPSEDIVKAGMWFIKNKLGNSLNYTTVHKRYMEGECPDIYRRMSNVSDFPADQLPMKHPSWLLLSNISHPLCAMDLDFIQEVQLMHHRSNQQLFLAYDGYGSIDAYRKIGAVISADLNYEQYPQFRDNEDCEQRRTCNDNRKFLDMFLAIHGDFFVLNPRSTYSWFVYVVRTALGLHSVPLIKNKDLLFYSQEDYEVLFLGKHWVGHYDIINAMNKLEPLIPLSDKPRVD